MLNISDADIKFQIENLKVTVIHMNYGVFYKPFPKHRHGNNFYEAHLVTSGSGTLIADGKEYKLSQGVLYMTGPLVVHEQIPEVSDPMDEYCIQFELRENKRQKGGRIAALLKETTFWLGEDTQNIGLYFELLAKEEEHKQTGYLESVTNIANLILIALVRNYAGNGQSTEYVKITPDDKRMVITDNSFLYDSEELKLTDLAERLNLSTRQTERFLKKAYGKTFLELRKETKNRK